MVSELEELPISCCVSTSKLSSYCSFCLLSSSNLKRCSKCAFLFYCSRQCQQDDWQQHKFECRVLSAGKKYLEDSRIDDSEFPDDGLRLVLRIWWLQKKKLAGSSDGRCLSDLVSHVDSVSKSIHSKDLFMAFYEKIRVFFKPLERHSGSEEKVIFPDAAEILPVYSRVLVNSFGIKNQELQSIGIGLYLSLCRLDHSCDPNGRIVFDGRKATVIPVTGTWKNDEVSVGESGCSIVHWNNIHHSYIENLERPDVRKELLQRNYFFDCHCNGCENKRRNAFMEGLMCLNAGCTGCAVQQKHSEETFFECIDCREPLAEVETGKMVLATVDSALKSLSRASKEKSLEIVEKVLCLQEGVLHKYDIQRLQLLKHAYKNNVRLERWKNAATYGEQLREVLEYYLKPFDPWLVIFLKNFARVFYNIKNFSKALQLLDDVEPKIMFIFGKLSKAHSDLLEFQSLSRSMLSKSDVQQ